MAGLLQIGRHPFAHHAEPDEPYAHVFLRLSRCCSIGSAASLGAAAGQTRTAQRGYATSPSPAGRGGLPNEPPSPWRSWLLTLRAPVSPRAGSLFAAAPG